MDLVIIDTGCANLSSVKFAFERLGVVPVISDDFGVIRRAGSLVLPGVGAAPYAMDNIKAKNLGSIIKTAKQPLLGICLGMQLLFETLEEGGKIIKGLGLIPGHVGPLDTRDLPSPHMGWNQLHPLSDFALMNGVDSGDYAYFVHSYGAPLSEFTVAACHYGNPFTAVVRKDNVMGCQFHPERSSKVGAQILKNFLDLSA
ncbi:MAG: imidazole glycerol phosphate synthase subunit HisH [Hellea sp.]|nr:imidazole glycerol phosphate synthase subunit HisH [Hellea sp.]